MNTIAESDVMTDEQMTRYEELETELQRAQRAAEIQKRNAAYNAVTPAGFVPAHTATKVDDTLDRAFDHFLRTGRENADLVELRAQSEGTPSEGGYIVPDGFRTKIVDRMKAFGGIANHVETYTTGDGRPVEWPTLDDTANTGEIVQEGGTFSGGADLVFGTANLGAYSYMAGGTGGAPLRVSTELVQDAAFDIQGLISNKLGERIARLQAGHLVTGDGSGKPKGLVHGRTPVQTAANTGVTYNDLVTFIHSVDPAYRFNCKWAMNDASLAAIKKLVDSHGDPLWRPADADMATATGGGTLMGYPVVIDQAFPDMDVDDSTDLWGAFGDFREGYVIRRVKDIEILVNPYSRMANRQIEFCAYARMDAVPQNLNAYIAISGKS